MLVWMDQGRCSLSIDERTVSLSPRDLALCRPGDETLYRWDPDSGRIGHVMFRSDHDPGWPKFIHLGEDDVIPAFLRHILWLQMERTEGWVASIYTVFGYVLELLRTGQSGSDLDHRPPLPAVVESVLVAVGRSWAGDRMRPPTLEELAAAAGVVPEYLSRVFTRELGFPPLATLRLLRLDHSAVLLRQTSATVRRIADECGFANEFHFSLAFKKWAGVSPTEYRAGGRSQAVLPPALAALARYLRRSAVESELPPLETAASLIPRE